VTYIVGRHFRLDNSGSIVGDYQFGFTGGLCVDYTSSRWVSDLVFVSTILDENTGDKLIIQKITKMAYILAYSARIGMLF